MRLLGGGQMLESVRSLSNMRLDMEGPQAGSEEEESEGWESDDASSWDSEDGDEGSVGWGSEEEEGVEWGHHAWGGW